MHHPDDREKPRRDQTGDPERDKQHHPTQHRPDRRTGLRGDLLQPQHLGSRRAVLALHRTRDPQDRRLRGRRKQGCSQANQDHAKDHHRQLPSQRKGRETGHPDRDPHQQHRFDPQPVRQSPAHEKQSLLGERPKPQNDPDQRRTKAQIILQIGGQKRHHQVEADIEGELGNNQQPQRVRQPPQQLNVVGHSWGLADPSSGRDSPVVLGMTSGQFDQHLGVRVGRVRHDFAGLTPLDDHPVLHNRDPIRQLGDHGDIMADEQHRQFLGTA